MKIRGRIIACVAGLTLTVTSAVVLAIASPVRELPVAQTTLPPSPAFAVEDSRAPHEYWLRELDGYVAVYLSEAREAPVEVTGIAVRSLRRADQEMFARGVLVTGAEELVRFLEDFGP